MWRLRGDPSRSRVPWEPREEWSSIVRDTALNGHDRVGPIPFQPSRPDQPESRYAVVAASREGSRAWRLELLGAPWTAVDRQYAWWGGSAILLTGFGWCLRLVLLVRPGRAAPAPYEVRTWLEHGPGATPQDLDPVTVSDTRPMTEADRSVLWTYLQPDEATTRGLAEHGLAPSTVGGVFFTETHRLFGVTEASHYHQPLPVSRGTQVVTLYQPLWAGRGGRALPMGAVLRIDSRMERVELTFTSSQSRRLSRSGRRSLRRPRRPVKSSVARPSFPFGPGRASCTGSEVGGG